MSDPATTKSPIAQKMEKFERKVVFRVARGYFFIMALLGVLVIVAGVLGLVFGVVRIPVMKGSAPTAPKDPPQVAPPKPISLALVDKWLADQKAQQQQPAASSSAPESIVEPAKPSKTGGKQATRDPRLDKIEKLTAKLRALFPEPTYSWNNIYRTICVRNTPFGCLKMDRKLEKEGVVNALRSLLRGESLDDTILLLSALVTVLGQADVERRGGLIVPTVNAYRSINNEYMEKLREREREVASLKAEYERKLTELESEYQAKRLEQERSKSTFRTYGFYLAVGGLALLILVALFLAHFAMERHLRLMQQLIAASRSGQTESISGQGDGTLQGEDDGAMARQDG